MDACSTLHAAARAEIVCVRPRDGSNFRSSELTPLALNSIIRILFMVPMYAISSYLQIQWYWHAIYFQVISDCYEAFAIASFFALLCHYVAPDLHGQKVFFRELRPIKPWVLPINWFAACCGGQRGLWRTPKSGLTWFNIIWIGVYHYCFIRVAMTISAVVSQYFHRYCESSNSPVFGHIWVGCCSDRTRTRFAAAGEADLFLQIIVLNALAVTVAMYCLIQFYVQLKEPLTEHKLFIKIVAIKLVVFLSFWQASAISIGTSTLKIVQPNEVIAYPDLKVGIPSLLLCIEMALFAILHLWAFPYAPYTAGAPQTYYPVPDPDKMSPHVANERQRPAGGFLGLMALWDALNIWDFVKAFGRGMRWLFCGVKRRKEDISYRNGEHGGENLDLDDLAETKQGGAYYDRLRPGPAASETSYDQYRPTTQQGFGPDSQRIPTYQATTGAGVDESAGLMDHAQPNPALLHAHPRPPPRPPRDDSPFDEPYQVTSPHARPQNIGVAHGGHGGGGGGGGGGYDAHGQPEARPPAPTETQARLGQALWGQSSHRP